MTRIPEKQRLARLVLALPLFFPLSATAAENTLNGGVTMGQAYDSNVFRAPTGEESEWKSTITPSLLYTRSEPTNKLSLNMPPASFTIIERMTNIWINLSPAPMTSSYPNASGFILLTPIS